LKGFFLSLYLEYLQVFFCTIEGVVFLSLEIGQKLSKNGQQKLVFWQRSLKKAAIYKGDI